MCRHAGDFSANQQAGKKLANLLARQRAQHVRSANFKQLRQNGGVAIPRSDRPRTPQRTFPAAVSRRPPANAEQQMMQFTGHHGAKIVDLPASASTHLQWVPGMT
jgi:hypothetical protein